MKTTLYEIRSELLHLNELLQELQGIEEGELSEDQEANFNIVLRHKEKTQEAEAAKLQSIIALIKYWEGWAEVRKKEAARIKALATADENRAKRLKSLLLEHLQGLGIERVSLLSYNLKVSPNGGLRKLVYKDEVSPLDLPQKFRKVSVDFNFDAIREYLESEVAEPLDFAYLEPRGFHLRIS